MFIKTYTSIIFKIRINISILTTLLLLILASGLQAQTPPLEELPQEAFTIELDKIPPVNPKVIIGELDNGIHYYILKTTN